MHFHRTLPRFLLALLTLFIAGVFLRNAETTPVMADTIGYTYAGEQVAKGKGLSFVDQHNATIGPYFSMFAYQIDRGRAGALYFGFPPGLPLLLGLGALVGRVYWVVPLLAVAGVLGSYALGRLSSGSEWVGFGAALLAWTPDFWRFGTAAWSEVPSVAFIAAGMAAYLFSRRESISPRQALVWGALSALLLAYSFFVRYANVVTVVPAIALYELATAGKSVLKERWRWSFFLLLGLALISILIFNHFYYGGPFTTNYSPEHGWYPQPAFSPAYALGPSFVDGHSFRAIVSTLWENFRLLLLVLPLGWTFLPRGMRIMHITAVLGTLALYAFYAFAASGVNSRFLLPAFPFVTSSIGAGLQGLSGRLPPRLFSAGLLLLLAILSLALPGRIQLLRARNAASADLAGQVVKMTTGFEQDAVFLSYVYNDQIIYYTGRSVLNYRRIPPSDQVARRYHWEWLGPCMNAMVAELIDDGTAVYYVKDQSPSFVNSLESLQAQFELEEVGTDPPIYRLEKDGSTSQIQEANQCPPSIYN